MPVMTKPPIPYRRDLAVAYAHRWAYGRNPAYFDYEELGGDCTNYASQCLFAGVGVMNYTPTYGWSAILLQLHDSNASGRTGTRRGAGRAGGYGAGRFCTAALSRGRLEPYTYYCPDGRSADAGKHLGGGPFLRRGLSAAEQLHRSRSAVYSHPWRVSTRAARANRMDRTRASRSGG